MVPSYTVWKVHNAYGENTSICFGLADLVPIRQIAQSLTEPISIYTRQIRGLTKSPDRFGCREWPPGTIRRRVDRHRGLLESAYKPSLAARCGGLLKGSKPFLMSELESLSNRFLQETQSRNHLRKAPLAL